ncbi:MAG TPA: hypothetical protein VJ396_01815 [Acidiferrobacterales bacterium]|nr:hypothetical protein [Acidiferrobacterales bacterium]
MLHLPAGREASPGHGVHRYERHRPEQTLLYQLVEQCYPAFVDQMVAHGRKKGTDLFSGPKKGTDLFSDRKRGQIYFPYFPGTEKGTDSFSKTPTRFNEE